MAKKEKLKHKIKDIALDTRILAVFALLEFCRTDVSSLSKEDFGDLYRKVSELNAKAFEDEKAFELAARYETDQITSIEDLKERMQRSRVLDTYKQLGYFGLCSGKEREHIPEAPEILSTIMYEAGIKNADELSVAIVKHELDDETSARLFKELNARSGSLKKQLASDFQTYKDQNAANPLIEDIAKDISEYAYDKNRVLSYGYDVRKAQHDFRVSLRESFNNGCKPEFLMLYGQMMTAGKNLSHGMPIESSYKKFKAQLTEKYGEDALDSILNITPASPAETEKSRQEAYARKSSEIYHKTMASILSQKWEYNQSHKIQDCDYRTYVKTVEDRYIPDLCRGFNNISVLAFQDAEDTRPKLSKAEEFRLNREKRDETAEQQIISVHHKIPISTIYDIYDAIGRTLPPEQKLKTCDGLVNNFSNMIYVIGREKHQSLEPVNGEVTITRNADPTIFAAEVAPQALRSILPQLSPTLREGIRQSVKLPDDNKKIGLSAAMRFPEPEKISSLRRQLAPAAHVSLIEKLQRYNG